MENYVLSAIGWVAKNLTIFLSIEKMLIFRLTNKIITRQSGSRKLPFRTPGCRFCRTGGQLPA